MSAQPARNDQRPQPSPPYPEHEAPLPAPHLRLDDLLDLGPEALLDLYRRARVPRLAEVRGDLRGRMLASVGVPAVLAALPHRWARTASFPWRGKSFLPRPGDAQRGDGINRVLFEEGERWRWFRFETFIGRSRAGDFDALQLDYDLPENPGFIRAIKDEIREIAPGLYLGQAYLQLRDEARLVLYFGLGQ